MTSSAINDFNSMNYGAFQTTGASKMVDPVEELMTGFQDAMKMAGDNIGVSNSRPEKEYASQVVNTAKATSQIGNVATYGKSSAVKDQLDKQTQATDDESVKTE